jgi:hypothetical protein
MVSVIVAVSPGRNEVTPAVCVRVEVKADSAAERNP